MLKAIRQSEGKNLDYVPEAQSSRRIRANSELNELA